MNLPPTIRVNVRVNFPAQMTGAGIVAISKANGVWKIGASYIDLVPPPSTQNQESLVAALQDPNSGIFYAVTAGELYGLGALVAREEPQGTTIAANTSDGDIIVGGTGSTNAPTT